MYLKAGKMPALLYSIFIPYRTNFLKETRLESRNFDHTEYRQETGLEADLVRAG
jgi:hypothetical protein